MSKTGNGALWLPMTTPHFTGPVITDASGAYVQDRTGRKYLHATSGLWNVNCGFGVEPILRAIHDQTDALAYSTLFRYSHEPAIRLADELVKRAPGDLTACFFTCSGSTAIEAGIKGARKYWALRGHPERQLIVSFDGSYHGTSYGALSVSHTNLGQQLFGVDRSLARFVAWPGEDTSLEESLEDLESGLRQFGHQVAAVLFEPVQGTTVRVMPEWFAADLVRLQREYEFLLFADEVTTGFGRTGTMFASEWLGLTPDIMALSKGINSGYLPLGATLFASHIREAFAVCGDMFESGETQAGNPVACAAALATLEYMDAEDLVAKGAAAGKELSARLGQLASPLIQEIRGRGLMFGIELQPSVTEAPGATWQFVFAAQELGAIIHAMPSGVALLPPLTITPEEIDALAAVLDSVLG